VIRHGHYALRTQIIKVWSISIAATAQGQLPADQRSPQPPGGLVAIAVHFTVVHAADWNGVFVADLAAKRARLSEADVVRFTRSPAAYDAGLRRDVSAVLLVAKPDRFCGHSTAAVSNRLLRQNDRGRRSIHRFGESRGARRLDEIILCGIYLSFGDGKAYFKRQDSLAETGLHAVGVCDGQGVLNRKIV
jgi:hypothetical protein